MSKESVWLVQDWKWCPKCGGRWGVTDQCECCSFNAALSAEPAAQGEEGFDARKYVRHMADVLEAGGDLFKVDADLLRLAAAINKAANTAPPAQPAERVPGAYVMDSGFKYESVGKHIPTVLVGFAPDDFDARDRFAAMLTATPAAPAEDRIEEEARRRRYDFVRAHRSFPGPRTFTTLAQYEAAIDAHLPPVAP